MTPSQQVVKFEDLLKELADIIHRNRVQTGELAAAKQKIDETCQKVEKLDQAIRGNGDDGVSYRLSRVEDILNNLAEKILPDLVDGLKANAAFTVERCAAARALELSGMKR